MSATREALPVAWHAPTDNPRGSGRAEQGGGEARSTGRFEAIGGHSDRLVSIGIRLSAALLVRRRTSRAILEVTMRSILRTESINAAGPRHFIGFVVVLALVGAEPVYAERVALVIGNADYAAPGALLTNSVDDARAVAAMLRELEFDVIEETDLSVEETARAVNGFIRAIQLGDEAVFYYAGHGMEMSDGQQTSNYLLPVDVSSEWDEVQVRLGSLSASALQERMELAGARVRILILDACRDNPFDGRSMRRGLGAMQPRGGLVVFAAEAGAAASDDGLFARHLVAALREPGLPATVLFEQVGEAVAQASGGRQRPAYYSAGAGGFVFRSGEALADVADVGLDVPRRDGERFRDCDDCPEMVVMPGGLLALGRYEVTGGEYLAFASATGGGARGGCTDGDGSWRDPDFPQTGRHPVVCVSWDDAQDYVSWLNQKTRSQYRLPTEGEWERAAGGSQPGCVEQSYDDGTCPVGSHGSNDRGLSDMLGNAAEWTVTCLADNCDRRLVRGGSWSDFLRLVHLDTRVDYRTDLRTDDTGFRVLRALNFGDYEEAFRWYRLAADQGDADGAFYLGRMYEEGRGVDEDANLGYLWYRRAADQGHAGGQFYLGQMYEHGLGVGVDIDNGQAVRWYRVSAEQGHAQAQSVLGAMYEDGKGLDRNLEEAFGWYRRAADQGDAYGQYSLGLMYLRGNVVPQDTDEALRLLRLAAAQGFELAFYVLDGFER